MNLWDLTSLKNTNRFDGHIQSIIGADMDNKAEKFVSYTSYCYVKLWDINHREAIKEYEFFFENKDGRIVLIFPLFDKVLIGTSDLPIEDPDDARCTEEEVDYFLDMIKTVFPDISVTREQIVFRFSGVRPLEYSQSKTTG